LCWLNCRSKRAFTRYLSNSKPLIWEPGIFKPGIWKCLGGARARQFEIAVNGYTGIFYARLESARLIFPCHR
jgi:hypothetical protein